MISESQFKKLKIGDTILCQDIFDNRIYIVTRIDRYMEMDPESGKMKRYKFIVAKTYWRFNNRMNNTAILTRGITLDQHKCPYKEYVKGVLIED